LISVLSVFCIGIIFSTNVDAHVSEQGFVLLLPTRFYIAAGVAAVALTVLLLAFTKSDRLHKLMSPIALMSFSPAPALAKVTSLMSLMFLVVIVVLGVVGSRDPLQNPLPLYIWTVWWIALVTLQGLVGNIWHYLNPWTGLLALFGSSTNDEIHQQEHTSPSADVTRESDSYPALLGFLVFAWLLLVYPAPDDPFRLAAIVCLYWTSTFIAMLIFGERYWLERAEFITVLMRAFQQLSPMGVHAGKLHIGLPGWKLIHQSTKSVQWPQRLRSSAALFVLALLAFGSFDGLNETFWWLSVIGVNPLEFPGRSALIDVTTLGLLGTGALLVLCFGLCIYAGNWMAQSARHPIDFKLAFNVLAVSVLPIAFAYHIAHFLTAFLVNIQYTLAATSDPLASGADWLGIGKFYVSTGFLNSHHSVEFIWLSQASVVVLGHIISVLLAHALANRLYADSRRALVSQIPLACFMILYTCLGLWLLAAPKGA